MDTTTFIVLVLILAIVYVFYLFYRNFKVRAFLHRLNREDKLLGMNPEHLPGLYNKMVLSFRPLTWEEWQHDIKQLTS
jgi:hypothetical protein